MYFFIIFIETMNNINVNTTSITFGALMAILGIGMTIVSFLKNNKRDIQVKATDYALLKSSVEQLRVENSDLKTEVKDLERELRSDIKRLDEQIITKIESTNKKIDELKDLIIKSIK